MFKKLRNKLLITNLAVTAALVICSLTAIFITTYSYIRYEIGGRLNRTIEMSMQRIERLEQMPNNSSGGSRPGFAQGNGSGGEQTASAPETRRRPENADKFSPEFSVYADADGNTIFANTNFNMVESDYSDIVKHIIESGKKEGSARLDIDSWAYRVVPYRDGYIVAFAQNSSQRRIILRLIAVLILAAVISTVINFFISLFSANRSIRPIEDSYNKQKQFIADASHELRTPLASISANTDVLMSRPESTVEEEMKWLTYIKDETERMTQLTNELLSLAKTDSDSGAQQLTRVSFSDIVENIVLESDAAAFENGISLSYTAEPDIFVQAAESGLRQLILILTDNALKYTPAKGEVFIRLSADADKAHFSIENTGEIDSADLPHLFERFYRADKSRSRESGGFGLGLAIADNLCRSFGGKLTVQSGGGKTRFDFSLPLYI